MNIEKNCLLFFCFLWVVLTVFIVFCWYSDHRDKIHPYDSVAQLCFNPFKSYEAWNRYHSDIFMIYPTDRLQFSYIRIGEECFRRGL